MTTYGTSNCSGGDFVLLTRFAHWKHSAIFSFVSNPTGAKSRQKPEVRGQKSQVRGQEAEDRSQGREPGEMQTRPGVEEVSLEARPNTKGPCSIPDATRAQV